MRILWLSRLPWAVGGYSNQTAVFTELLDRETCHQVALAGDRGPWRGMLDWKGMPAYPTLPNDPRNDSLLSLHYRHWRADLMVSLHDADQLVDGPALARRLPELRWALWFPIDGDPLPETYRANLAHVRHPITMSRFGERVAREAGFESTYIPHGVDTRGAFRPQDRRAARRALGWPEDLFITGMVAANNGTRKAFPQNLRAFARFHRRHPDSMLYLHTQEAAVQGVDLAQLCADLGLRIGQSVRFCDAYEYLLGFSSEDLATVYSALDVLQCATKGEGFGIPIVEAQACGTPVIVGDWSAMAELCFGGWRVEREESQPQEVPGGTCWRIPSVEAIEDRLERAYAASRDPETARSLREAARQGAEGYDARVVLEKYWVPFLDRVGREVETGAEDEAAVPVA